MTWWNRRRLLAAAALAGLVLGLVARFGPLPAGLLDFSGAESTRVLDRHGELLYEARNGEGGRSAWLTAAQLPPRLVEATVAAEDRRFLHHPGIDPIAVLRALAHNVRAGRRVEGGSTITQQVVKLLLVRREGAAARGLTAKLREAVLALRLEHRLSKADILALYLNLAPYGNQFIGASRASRAYFGHEPALLTAAQAAFLASLPQRPSAYNPYRDPARARLRQERVIVQMGLAGALTPDEVRTALDERLALRADAAPLLAPHFVERVLAGQGDAGPSEVRTTLDASLQRDVRGIIRAARPALERYGAHNVAVAVLDNATGGWLAWEGSGDYDDEEHGGRIDGVTTPRQPGSALKPFTYALAFDRGESPASVLPDVPSYFPTAEEGVVYSPRNYDNQFRGPMRARRALAGSENVPAVVLASRVGVPSLLRFLRAAGFTTLDKTAAYYGLGVTLGDAEVRLDQLVAAYAAFARGGVLVEPTFTLEGARSPGATLVSPRTAFWITNILADPEARAFAFGRGGSLEFPFQVAAKTGTSQAYHDNWAIGYTRDVTVGVWVGNFDRRPLIGSSGVTGAGPIFHAVMLAAAGWPHGATPDPLQPASLAPADGTRRQAICALSGLLATDDCPQREVEFLATEAPGVACTWHRRTLQGVVVDWPVEYQGWAAGTRLMDAVVAGAAVPTTMPSVARTASTRADAAGAADSPAVRAAARPVAQPSGVRVLNPPDGAVYLIDPTLRREFQTLSLRGASGAAGPIEWWVDGELAGRTEPGHPLDWPLVPGAHTISARDREGRTASSSIVVK